ncbi:MAG: alanine racemase [Deltaproteobacteria bacterium]|nr:alanine racemase [Deltaproteobacteria bacterium]MBI4795759.1 alanine racemase [Deltaproteobacteria bacterium]
MIVTSMADLAVDLAALRHNYRQLRGLCDAGVKFMGVVKADAYGHGLLPVAGALVAEGADYLGVGSLEEGLVLRQAGLALPVLLLLGILPDEAEPTVAAGLEVALFRPDVAQALAAAAGAQGKKAGIHLKVDTGMGRLGLLPEDVLPFLEGLRAFPQLEVLGLTSHLAVADQEDKSYTLRQLGQFEGLLRAARDRGWELPLSHIANSAALWEHKKAHFALVRPGIMLYGSPPAAERRPPVLLQPVMSLATRVLQVKRLPPGCSISYGRTYTTPAECDLAVLPVGYANGYSRLFSNRGEVLIRGRRAPIRGRVCMNLTMVEVSHLEDIREGEPVVLLGQSGNACLTGDDLAGWADTISYEIYLALGNANPRRYLGV